MTTRSTTAKPRSPKAIEADPVPLPPDLSEITVTGGGAVKKDVTVGGSVHAAQALLAGAVLQSRPVTLKGVPASAHIEQMIALVSRAGWDVRHEPGQVTVKPRATASLPGAVPGDAGGLPDLFGEPGARSPAAVYLISALLGVYGCAALPWPATGPESVHEVLMVHKAFGDHVETSAVGYTVVAAEATDAALEIAMPTRAAAPTIAAVLRACVTGTRIHVRHASRHPEVHALIAALCRLGWPGHYSDERLELAPGTSTLPALSWSVPGDGLAAAACICALAATRRSGTVRGVSTRELTVLRMLLAQAGVRIELASDTAKVYRAWNPPGSQWSGLAVRAGDEPRDLPSEQVPLLFPFASAVFGHHRLADPNQPARIDALIDQLASFGVPVERRGPGEALLTGPASLEAPPRPGSRQPFPPPVSPW